MTLFTGPGGPNLQIDYSGVPLSESLTNSVGANIDMVSGAIRRSAGSEASRFCWNNRKYRRDVSSGGFVALV